MATAKVLVTRKIEILYNKNKELNKIKAEIVKIGAYV